MSRVRSADVPTKCCTRLGARSRRVLVEYAVGFSMVVSCHSLDPDRDRIYPPATRVVRTAEAPPQHTQPPHAAQVTLESLGSAAPMQPYASACDASAHDASARDASARDASARDASARDASARDETDEDASPAPSQLFPNRPCRIAVLGDSLTDPKSGGGGYLKELQRACPECAIDNFGKGASMVVQMRRKFEHTVAPALARYSHLVVFGGVNDMYSDETAARTPARVARDLSRIYEKARAAGTRVVAINIAPWGGFKRYFNRRRGAATLEVNAWLERQLAAGSIDYVVDAYSVLSCGDPERLCPEFAVPFKDGIHFGPAGHAVLGRALVRSVFPTCAALPTDSSGRVPSNDDLR